MKRSKPEKRCAVCKSSVEQSNRRKGNVCSEECQRKYAEFLGPRPDQSSRYAQGDYVSEENEREAFIPPTREKK